MLVSVLSFASTAFSSRQLSIKPRKCVCVCVKVRVIQSDLFAKSQFIGCKVFNSPKKRSMKFRFQYFRLLLKFIKLIKNRVITEYEIGLGIEWLGIVREHELRLRVILIKTVNILSLQALEVVCRPLACLGLQSVREALRIKSGPNSERVCSFTALCRCFVPLTHYARFCRLPFTQSRGLQ